MTVSIRQAVPGDAPALAALRVMMFEAMGVPVDDDCSWRSAFETWVAARFVAGEVAAFVAEHPTDGLVSVAVGQLNQHAPSPYNPAGLSGHVSNVVTAPGWRGQGLARQCLEALVEWFRDSTTACDLNLSATAEGSGLYRQLGFAERGYPSMRLTLDRAT